MDTEQSTYRRVASGFTVVLSAIGDDQWGNRTPCDEWSAAELASHVVATHQRVYAMVNPEGISDVDADARLVAQWAVVAAELEHALSDTTMANTPVRARSGEQPFSALIEGLLMIDTLCHAWDLARAVGADETLDGDAVLIAHERLSAMGEAIRVPGGFKNAVVPLGGANEQTKFLNFAGRTV